MLLISRWFSLDPKETWFPEKLTLQLHSQPYRQWVKKNLHIAFKNLMYFLTILCYTFLWIVAFLCSLREISLLMVDLLGILLKWCAYAKICDNWTRFQCQRIIILTSSLYFLKNHYFAFVSSSTDAHRKKVCSEPVTPSQPK